MYDSKYNRLFRNIIPNSIEGIKIFSSSDQYIKPQKYNDVTNLENKIWADLFQRLEFLLDQYASKEYLMGLRTLPIPNNMFPEFEAISPLLENSTNWKLVPVAGFLEEELFFELNKDRKFPVTDIIRKSPRFDQKYSNSEINNAKGYTPEPDIFHDIQGHIPLLMNKKYADFLCDVGILGYKIVKDEKGLGPELVHHNLKRLQNFSWWTYEYGLLKKDINTDKFRRVSNDIPYEIYGSGIISSYDETKNVINCAKGNKNKSKFLKYDIEEVVLTCFDYSDIQDRYFVIESMDFLYQSFKENQELFFFEG